MPDLCPHAGPEDEYIEPLGTASQRVRRAARRVDDAVARPHDMGRAVLPEQPLTLEDEEDLLLSSLAVHGRRPALGGDLNAVDTDVPRAGGGAKRGPASVEVAELGALGFELVPVDDHGSNLHRHPPPLDRRPAALDGHPRPLVPLGGRPSLSLVDQRAQLVDQPLWRRSRNLEPLDPLETAKGSLGVVHVASMDDRSSPSCTGSVPEV